MSLIGSFLKAPSAGSLFSLAAARHGVRTQTGIAYGEHPRHRLDVYSPPDRKPVDATIMFIYGGGWDSGQRQMYGFAGAALAARGYVTVIPDYRLFPDIRYPDFMTDIASAYAWTATKKAAGIGAGAPLILMGHSAGAHMAALLAYDRQYLDQVSCSLTRPDGFIGLSGPYGFDAKAHARSRGVFATAATEQQVKPVAQVKKDAPPALLLHGAKDTTVLTLNAYRMRDALQAAGSHAQAHEFEHAGHMDTVLALAWPYTRKFDVLARIDLFIAAFKGRS